MVLLSNGKREHESDSSRYDDHGMKKPLSLKELQEYIGSSLPGVGSGLAKPLLKKFKSIKKLVNAKEEKLQKVSKIGREKARKIREV